MNCCRGNTIPREANGDLQIPLEEHLPIFCASLKPLVPPLLSSSIHQVEIPTDIQAPETSQAKPLLARLEDEGPRRTDKWCPQIFFVTKDNTLGSSPERWSVDILPRSCEDGQVEDAGS